MSKQNPIRRRWHEGLTVTETAREEGASRDTVHKYRDKGDFSPSVPVARERPSKLDPYKPLIDQWLGDDAKSGAKQRHTAKRVHDRLVGEEHADVSPGTVERYARKARAPRPAGRDQFLDLVWAPGEAQADFGEADFCLRGARTRPKHFALAFPLSNVGLAQAFPGEDAECVCQGPGNAFEHVGGVPGRIVLDNAAGVGRKMCDAVRTTEPSEACSAHHGFACAFCNPHSGHEKGSVENEVGAIRRNLFVPVPQAWDVDAFDRRLLGRRMAMADRPHRARGEPERQPFGQGALALAGLPGKPFECVTYVVRTADKKGKASVGEGGGTATRPIRRPPVRRSPWGSGRPGSRPTPPPASPCASAPARTAPARPTPPTRLPSSPRSRGARARGGAAW